MFIMRNLFRRKNLPNKRSILSSWFFSYVIVLMLIIVLVAFAEKMYMNFMMEDRCNDIAIVAPYFFA